jgi:hypothetical protein
MKSSDQFKEVNFEGRKAFEGFSAVLNADGVHVALVAPSLDALDEVWQRFHVRPVDRDKAQKVYLVKAPSSAEGKDL